MVDTAFASAESAAEATSRVRTVLSAGLEAEVRALRQLRPARRLGEIAMFTAIWAVGIGVGSESLHTEGAAKWALGVLGIAVCAIALNAFYLLTHEGHHHLLFRGAPANRWANLVLSVPLLHGPTAYRVLHDLHHRYVGGPGDPDEYRNYTGSRRQRWALQWVRLTMGTLVYMPLIPVVAWRRAEPDDRHRIAWEYGILAPVWTAVCVVLPMDLLLQVWLLPGVVVGYISAVRALAQHALTEPRDPLLASRSVQSNGLVAFVLLNENFHLEHHLFPEVPSYHLPRLRALLAPRLTRTVQADSYAQFLLGFFRRSWSGDESVLGLRSRRDESWEPKGAS